MEHWRRISRSLLLHLLFGYYAKILKFSLKAVDKYPVFLLRRIGING